MEITAVVELCTLRKRPWGREGPASSQTPREPFVQGGQFAEINRPPMSAGENLAGNFSPDAQTDPILPQIWQNFRGSLLQNWWAMFGLRNPHHWIFQQFGMPRAKADRLSIRQPHQIGAGNSGRRLLPVFLPFAACSKKVPSAAAIS